MAVRIPYKALTLEFYTVFVPICCDLSSTYSYYIIAHVYSISKHVLTPLQLYNMRTGPSPPRNISVRVTSSPEVRITWSPPALPRGVIALYKVYAEPVNTPTDIVNAVDLPVPVFKVCAL